MKSGRITARRFLLQVRALPAKAGRESYPVSRSKSPVQPNQLSRSRGSQVMNKSNTFQYYIKYIIHNTFNNKSNTYNPRVSSGYFILWGKAGPSLKARSIFCIAWKTFIHVFLMLARPPCNGPNTDIHLLVSTEVEEKVHTQV